MKIIFAFLLFISFKAICQISPRENNFEKFKGIVKSYKEDYFHAIDSFGELKKISHTASFFVLLDENNNIITSTGFDKKGKDTLNVSYKTSKYYFEINGKRNYGNREPNFKTILKYDTNGNIIEKCEYENDTLEKKEIANYDTKNHLIEYKSYREDGKVEWQRNLKYDLKGNIIEVLNYNIYGYYAHEKNNYDNNNKLILSISIDQNEKTEFKKSYKYDRLGNLNQEITTYVNYENRNYNNKKVFQYSNKGKITSEVRYNCYGVEYDRRTYNYDSKGRLIFEETPFGKHTYAFDLSGNLLEEIDYYYDDNRNIESKSITKYEYDSKGNWIKKIHSYIESPKIIPDEYTVTERAINYR